MEVKVALCPIDAIVGDLRRNADTIHQNYLEAAAEGAEIVLTPEMGLTGYPLDDLTQKPAFLRDVEAERLRLVDLVKSSGMSATLVFGHPVDTGADDGNRRLVHNSVTLVDPTTGSVSVQHKVELPNYGVFDEKRNYLEGPAPDPIKWRGIRLGLMICEDGWFPSVAGHLFARGADALLWVNGSPFAVGKNVLRRRHAAARSIETGLPVAYVNLSGAQDELVFDGDRFAWDGRTLVEGVPFDRDVLHVSLRIGCDASTPRLREMPDLRPTGIAETYRALVEGVADYLAKNGFDRVVIGYSGGVDSGLVAAIAADAIGPKNVLLVRLPSRYSSDGSKDDAWTGAERLGCPLRTIDIEPMVEASRLAYASQSFDIGPAPAFRPTDADRRAAAFLIPFDDNFKEAFLRGEHDDHPRNARWLADLRPSLTGVSDENIQARARGNILMAISNQEGMMLLNTTNRTESLTGYGTLHGDMAGGYGPLKDVYKTDVWALCRHRNAMTREDLDQAGLLGPVADVVPEEIISKPPSAELRPDQKDTDNLPPYDVLDRILQALVDDETPLADIVAAGVDAATAERVQTLVYRAEYKRRLAAPGVKIGHRLLGRDRRYPIVNAYRESVA